ncbi:hypothetical protein J7426_02925 [Tropicibacter sp. R16_0]|uniref:hypothetical protein n=1 Tax=Tropicibacter sp. R16_0 TaxID=2821102 RepID=UPI001ADD192B|nr:hypothetical protein [Tropicibacter sp. R16_0]MBO9449195.1 hypothetical protein [Tropicibacter sp. R16_0]
MILRALLFGLLLVAASPALAKDEDDREGGIIGTGIVGTITELGSIIVNGHRITLDDDMPVAESAPGMVAKDLIPGLTVAVVVTQGDEAWKALHVRQVLPLIGPVTKIEADHLIVLGTRVKTGQLGVDVRLDDWIAVSGLWRGDAVEASHIARLPKAEQKAQVSGTYLGADAQGHPVVGTTQITGVVPTHLSVGDVIRVEGEAIAGGIQASRLEKGLFDDPVSIVQIEGYHSPPQPDGLYTVLGSGMVAYTQMPGMISQSERVITCGSDGVLGSSNLSATDAEISGRLGCDP